MKRGKKGRYVRMESRHRICKKAIRKRPLKMLQSKRKIKLKSRYLPFRAKKNKNENTILALSRCRFSIYFESKHSF